MRVARVRAFMVAPRWVFVKVEADDGAFGWGEASLAGRSRTMLTLIEELAEHVVGRDPMRIEDIWQELYRCGFFRGGPHHMTALGGIDIALWDLKGRVRGAPVHDLLGGRCRERMRVYSWIGGDRPAEAADEARARVEAGFSAVKMNGTGELAYVDSHAAVDAAVERALRVREAVGPGVGLGIDFHGRVHRPMAKVLLRALEPVRPMFVEEPVLPENMHVLPGIASGLGYPIAAGERCYHRSDFRPLLEAGAIDVAQPDVVNCGGITETRKVATMAEAYDVALAPHCPLGPLALAASLQIDAVSHNAFIQEQSAGIHYNAGRDLLDYLVDPAPLTPVAGHLPIPSGPGLGVEVDEAEVEAAAAEARDWRNPVWRHGDGSVAEW